MGGKDLWKYCTAEQVRITLRSLHLLDGVHMEEEKYFSCLYAVSNHPELHYRQASVPKKGGGVRNLLVPDYLLCRIQKNILHGISDWDRDCGNCEAPCRYEGDLEIGYPQFF